MRAQCEQGHDRVEMIYSQARMEFICPECLDVTSGSEIDRQVPEAYKRTSDPLKAGLQKLADYEVIGVLVNKGYRKIVIEYDRPANHPEPAI